MAQGKPGQAKIHRLSEQERQARRAIGVHIRRIRYARGLYQRELGKLLGLTQGNISSLECGERGSSVSLARLQRVARTLNDKHLMSAVTAAYAAAANWKVRARALDPDNWNTSYAQIVRGYRCKQNLSGSEVARRCGVHQAVYTAAERGRSRGKGHRRVASHRVLRVAAKVLGVQSEADERIGRKNNNIMRLIFERAKTPREIGQDLARCRCRLHLSQDDLADISGYAPPTVYYIEYGRRAQTSRFAFECVLAPLGIKDADTLNMLHELYQNQR